MFGFNIERAAALAIIAVATTASNSLTPTLAKTAGVTLSANPSAVQVRGVAANSDTTEKQLVDSGNQKLNARDFAGAIQDFSQALQINPNDEVALRGRGTARRATGDYAGALADLNASIQLVPTDDWALFQRGMVYKVQNNFQAALSDFNAAVSLYTGEPQYYERRGQVRYALGDDEGATVDSSRAVALDPQSEDAWFVLGLENSKQKYFWSAANDYKEVIGIDPNYGDAHYNLANAYRNMNMKEEAIAEYKQAAQIYAASNDPTDQNDALAQVSALQGAA